MSLALAISDALDGPATRLRVALRTAAGAWDWAGTDPATADLAARLRPLSVRLGADADLAEARIAVDLSGDTADGEIVTQPLDAADLDERIQPDQRLVIYAENEPPAGQESRAFLFDGFFSLATLEMTADAELAAALCVAALDRVDRDPRSKIRGRYMHTIDYIEEERTASVRHAPAAPVVFNPGGRPNCHQAVMDVYHQGANFEAVPVFTYEGDPDARNWRICDVLRYLLVFHLDAAAADLMISDGNGIDWTLPYMTGDMDPVPLDDENTTDWASIMRGPCPELHLTGMRLVEQALPALCRVAGMRFQQITLNADGEPDTQVVYWIRGAGGPWESLGSASAERVIAATPATPMAGPRSIRLPARGSRLAEHPGADLVAGRMVWDSRNSPNAALRLGDPVLHEVTIGRGATVGDDFRPGWLPDQLLGDNLSGQPMLDKIAEIRRAVSPTASGDAGTMYKRYDRRGENHAEYLAHGRLWVLNESGEYGIGTTPGVYDGSMYGRENGGETIWSPESYVIPYNFHELLQIPVPDDPTSGDPAPWTARRRAVLDPLSLVEALGRPGTPVLECSWNGGANWYPYPGSYRFAGGERPDEAQIAVLLIDQNLGEVKNDKPEASDTTGGRSVWEAIVRGVFRLSLSCAVAGDELVTGSAASAGGPENQVDLTARTPNLRKYVISPGSRLSEQANWLDPEIDDSARAAGEARTYVAGMRARTIAATLAVGQATNDWLPGDLCDGIQPRGIEFRATGESGGMRRPEVIRAVVSAENGMETAIVLDDARMQTRTA